MSWRPKFVRSIATGEALSGVRIVMGYASSRGRPGAGQRARGVDVNGQRFPGGRRLTITQAHRAPPALTDAGSAARRTARGSVKVNVEPIPDVLSARRSPPMPRARS